MNQIALFPLQDATFETQILSQTLLQNKYYTATLTFKKMNSISDITPEFQAIILDDQSLLSLLDPDFTIFYIGSNCELEHVICINPLEPNALQDLKSQLDLIDWPDKSLKSTSDPLLLFERLLDFRKGDNVEMFATLLDEMTSL